LGLCDILERLVGKVFESAAPISGKLWQDTSLLHCYIDKLGTGFNLQDETVHKCRSVGAQ
jgi:hypothetical protein